ncbi:hypothetical protein K435DRAFT_607976, partial [Dendrothele bispora CBS 962.96]
GRVLEEETAKAQGEMRKETEGLHGTGQCDGWKNVAKSSLVTSMVNVEYNPFLLGVEDVSEERKTAVNLMIIILNKMKRIHEFFKVILVAWCTDASGESAKMHRDLLEKFPWLVVLDCWAHQINLVVGDTLKLKVPLIAVADQAIELVKWFNNHSVPLGLLRQEQATFRSVVLALILPVLTRWTSHFLAMDRLLELKAAFRRLVEDTDKCATLISASGNSAPDKAKARKLIKRIKDENFWTKIESLRNLLRPFAIAANAIQADNCRLDTVLLIIANLYRIHSQSVTIDARADRNIFILAVVFNPYIRSKAFNPSNQISTPGRIWLLVRAAFTRFSKGQEPDDEFREAFRDYYGGIGSWSDLNMGLADYHSAAQKRGGYVHLVKLWRDFEIEDSTGSECSNGVNGMVRLAMRILRIVPNSASTERVLSRFGSIHTKSRNRLHAEKVRSMTIVAQQIERTHGIASSSRYSKQNFGNDVD